MYFRDLQELVHKTSVDHGWYDTKNSFSDYCANFHGEISEAWEQYRAAMDIKEIYFGDGGKPEGVPIELADAVIRIMDFCEHCGIDLERCIVIKNKFNETRPYRHGNKVV